MTEANLEQMTEAIRNRVPNVAVCPHADQYIVADMSGETRQTLGSGPTYKDALEDAMGGGS